MPQKRNKRGKRAKTRARNPLERVPRAGRSSAAHSAPLPYRTALKQTPLFREAVMQKGMLYYDCNLTRVVPLGGAAATNYFFTANGLYDPDITGTGHQPMGFDTMMTFYEQYTVVSSAITVAVYSDYDVRVALFINPDAVSVTEQRAIVENGLAKTVAINGAITETSRPHHQLSLNCDCRDYFGRRTQQELMDDTSLQGTATSNPTEQVYFAITAWFNGLNPGANKNIWFDICLSYDVIFWEPRKVALS
jgi:hypothetical protein